MSVGLEDLIQLLRDAWPARFERGRVLHVHRNALRLPNGNCVHIRLLVQTISEAEAEIHQQAQKDKSDNMEDNDYGL